MKRRLALLCALLSIVFGTVGINFATSFPAHASGPEICDNEGGSSLCANRSGGGTAIGTNVIGWSAGDSNNDFSFLLLDRKCNNGQVDTTCPFINGSGLNLEYDGDQIVTLVTPHGADGEECIGGTSALSAGATLQGCPADDGSGGGWSAQWVLAPSKSSGGTLFYVLVNIRQSDNFYGISNPKCYGAACTQQLDDCFISPKGVQLDMSGGDSNVQAGNPDLAANCGIWAEVP